MLAGVINLCIHPVRQVGEEPAPANYPPLSRLIFGLATDAAKGSAALPERHICAPEIRFFIRGGTFPAAGR